MTTNSSTQFVNVGERTNVTGSAAFKKLIMAGDEHDARLRVALVTRLGGQHHGCVLLSETATAPKIALTLFLFPSLAKCGR